MKNIYMTRIVIASIFALSIASPAYAIDFGNVKERIEDRMEDRQEKREERKDERKEATKPGLLNRLFNRGNRVTIVNGKVTIIAGTTLTVEKDGKSFTVNTDTNTEFRRKFWGKSALDEFAVGNMVNVIGHWTDDAHTSVLAKQVRNLSIQKRFGIFFGVVKSLSTNGWVMSTISDKRAEQTVTVSSTTKFTNRKEETISQSDVKVGARVRVRGLWDSSANTVTEVTAVKDFSLPIKVTTTVTPTVTVAATTTVAPTATP
ncbi:hypothetical protein KBC80_00130 [Candidatus Woesebacteria bacterium]|nr:hypothetical protein [Candidatus Woesebacteria bacterium]